MTEQVKVDIAKIEDANFYMIVIATAMIALGTLLGSFIPGAILLSIIGSVFVMLGIAIYMITQFKSG